MHSGQENDIMCRSLVERAAPHHRRRLGKLPMLNIAQRRLSITLRPGTRRAIRPKQLMTANGEPFRRFSPTLGCIVSIAVLPQKLSPKSEGRERMEELERTVRQAVAGIVGSS